MKKSIKKPIIICLALAVIALFFVVNGIVSSRSVKAEPVTAASGAYSFRILKYEVEIDLKSDRTMHVKENIAIRFTGYSSTGFFRDIPTNAGEQVRNAKVTYQQMMRYQAVGDNYELVEVGGKNVYPHYDVDIEDYSFLTLDIGDYSNKTNDIYKFGIEYDYILTKVTDKEKNLVALSPIGAGWEAKIDWAFIVIHCPAAIDMERLNVYYSTESNLESECFYEFDEEDNTFYALATDLYEYEGVTVDLYFDDGVLTKYFDMTPYWVLIVCGALALIFALVKMLVFNKNGLTPVVNFDAPNDMDPLMMGKLIDNKVNPEDLAALIYYWADKGFIKIDLTNEKNPTFIRLYQSLPNDYPDYQQVFFSQMFRFGDAVALSALEYNMQSAVRRSTTLVNEKTKGLYSTLSFGISVALAIIASAVMMFAPIIICMATISSKLFFIPSLFIIIPAIIIFALTESIIYNKLKLGKKKIIGFACGVIALILLCGIVYAVIIPASVMSVLPKFLIGIAGGIAVATAATMLLKTKSYKDKLNQIIGFKNFIQLAEKDRLEKLIEEDPEFFYHILPYAQVLNVSDKWEEKFKDIAVAPPSWATTQTGTLLQFYALNRILRVTSLRMATRMAPRPTSSPISSGRSGFGGGFGGGGGHGGGGGRGR